MPCGYRVLTAACGKGALKVIAEENAAVDLLITDVVMPGMPGPTLAEFARREVPELKVIFMPGYSDEILAGDFVKIERYAYLQKPLSPAVCHERLKEVLGDVKV